MRNSSTTSRLVSIGEPRAGLLILAILLILCLIPAINGQAGLGRNSNDTQNLSASSPLSNYFGMNAGDGPKETSAVYLNMPAVIGGSNIDTSRPETRAELFRISNKIDFAYFDLRTTAAVISPKKASEFTLVGAKPSGTM